MIEILLTLTCLSIAILLGAFASLYFKIGSEKISRRFFENFKNFELIKGAILYGISVIFYVNALKGGELSVLYPVVSLGYVIVCFLSVKFLNEKMNKKKWFGIALIILGVSLIGIGST